MTAEVQLRKRALVTGGAGQDGWYLIELLLSHGYEIFAHSRRPIAPAIHGDRVNWRIGDLTDDGFLQDLLSTSAPHEIYNLAAVSRPALSWDIPIETARLNALVPQRICEFIRSEMPTTRLFQASSSEIYGDGPAHSQDEETRANPRSPYGISKAYAHQIVSAYRQQYGLHLSCGILFNHESPRRPLGFVSQKIAHAAAAAAGGGASLKRGNWTNAAGPFCQAASFISATSTCGAISALPAMSSKPCASSCKATWRRISSLAPGTPIRSRSSVRSPSGSAVSTGPSSWTSIRCCCARSTATSRRRIPQSFGLNWAGGQKWISPPWSI
jgi:hypothetical protein